MIRFSKNTGREPGIRNNPSGLHASTGKSQKAGLIPRILETKPKACEEETLALAHEPAYLAQAKKGVLSGRSTLSTGDTQICADSWEVARRATGGVLQAVDDVMNGKITRAFCLSRPPAIMQPRAKGWAFAYSITLRLPQGTLKKNTGSEKSSSWTGASIMATERKTSFTRMIRSCFSALTNLHGIREREAGKKREREKAWATP